VNQGAPLPCEVFLERWEIKPENQNVSTKETELRIECG